MGCDLNAGLPDYKVEVTTTHSWYIHCIQKNLCLAETCLQREHTGHGRSAVSRLYCVVHTNFKHKLHDQ